jgi:predicted TIM-barrel fold metal-dependent hydrolase
VWDAELAAAEVRRCADKGTKALCWVEDTAVLGLPSYHTDAWDPLWAAVQEVDIPICMHIGSGGASTTNFAAMSTPMVEIAVAFTQAARCCINMACSPVLRKFPNLKMVWSEGGIGWLPAALERADRQWDRHRAWQHMDDVLPSELVKRNMWFCMIEEPWGLTTRDFYGSDRVLWESDYPHADTPWPNTQAACKELFEGVPDDVVQAITHGNSEALFDFPLTVPDDAHVGV